MALQVDSKRSSRSLLIAENVEVIYVETKEELKTLNGDLWYNVSDFHQFRKEALQELVEFMDKNGIHDAGEALALMY